MAAPKESFFAYSTQFIFLTIGLWYTRKELHHGGMDIWNYIKTRITFNVFCLFIYLFVCLIIFVHFYICNVWFALTNNKILKLSFYNFKGHNILFVCTYVQILWMVFLEAAIKIVFIKTVIHFRYTWGILVRGSFPVKLQAVCQPFSWKWTPS